jgi:pantothenate kinase
VFSPSSTDEGGSTGGGRRILGITGAPGAGKTRLATVCVAQAGPHAVHLPMDGFHLADVTLTALGLLDRKGAPETFDPWGYAALLSRLRRRRPETVYAPGFERDLEQPIAGAIAVPASADLVVTEGNYLLLGRPEWQAVRAQLDEVWFVHVEHEVRRERLIARHVAFGKTPEAAREWVQSVDEANVRLVEETRARADRVIDLTGWDGSSPLDL